MKNTATATSAAVHRVLKCKEDKKSIVFWPGWGQNLIRNCKPKKRLLTKLWVIFLRITMKCKQVYCKIS
jgi:hypothetical protein